MPAAVTNTKTPPPRPQTSPQLVIVHTNGFEKCKILKSFNLGRTASLANNLLLIKLNTKAYY